jgi:hypothetical protein
VEDLETFEHLVEDGHHIGVVDVDQLLEIYYNVLDIYFQLRVFALVLGGLAVYDLDQLLGVFLAETQGV